VFFFLVHEEETAPNKEEHGSPFRAERVKGLLAAQGRPFSQGRLQTL